MTDLHAPPGPAQLAAPPIVIGPFTNVPAPGSPIRSDWPQTISQYCADGKAGDHVGHGWATYPSQATLNAAGILAQAPTVKTYATVMYVTANGRAGSDVGTMDGITVTVTPTLGAPYASPGGAQTMANRFGLAAVVYAWAVAANASAGFLIKVGWAATSGGTTFVQADLQWHQYRA